MPVAVHTDWLDGPRFVAWLEVHGLACPKPQLGYLDRRIRDWRKGVAASVQSADTVLVALDLSLGMVPDDLYVQSPWAPYATPAAVQEEIVERVLVKRQTMKATSRALGVTPRTVRKYVQRARLAA